MAQRIKASEAVLGHRLEKVIDHATATGRARTPHRMIVGLIPAAAHVNDADKRRALDERATLIEQRATALAEQAIADRAPWLRELGYPPQTAQQREQWMRCVIAVAAYRDRHSVTGLSALGHQPSRDDDWALRADRRHAQRAVQDAREINGMLDVASPVIARAPVRRPPRLSL
ncbi:hypothetical protein [Phytoactinopolyspora endophytica]|uniref:hypothetical protein n=1 Tax=Phytoactinopolyspora endophytica TaxID=1642495 RepID=UPI00101B9854|nr:hypothetical protein [Phytoactinopolyspora endophytica]